MVWLSDEEIVCPVAVAMETTRLILRQFKNFLAQWIENWIRNKVCLCQK